MPSRRVYIPKPDGGTRPLGVAALEDKIVQKAVAETILTPIYESEFLGFSYGFRPGRGAHNALDAVAVGIERRRTEWLVDADIRGFFDNVSRAWLVRFLEYRIGGQAGDPIDHQMVERRRHGRWRVAGRSAGEHRKVR